MRPPRLSADQKACIISEYRDGVSVTVIAKKFGISDSYPTKLAKLSGYKPRGHGFRGWQVAIKRGGVEA